MSYWGPTNTPNISALPRILTYNILGVSNWFIVTPYSFIWGRLLQWYCSQNYWLKNQFTKVNIQSILLVQFAILRHRFSRILSTESKHIANHLLTRSLVSFGILRFSDHLGGCRIDYSWKYKEKRVPIHVTKYWVYMIINSDYD